MKIKEVRTRVFRWRGKTVPLPPHFCTNPMDSLQLRQASMGTFTFHGWLVVEIFTDEGLVGIGNSALAPQVTKQTIDLYLKPLLVGQNPWDIEFLWQHMFRKTMAFGRKGIGMVAISAVDIALWDLLGKSARQPVYRLLGGRTKSRIPVYASRLYSVPLNDLAAEAKRYKDEGSKAMKLRFGWGPADGAAGMQRNVQLVRAVREAVGDGIDVTRLVQIQQGTVRRVALVEEPHLRLLDGCRSVYELAQATLADAVTLGDAARQRATSELLGYEPVYGAHSEWRLLPPIDHPDEPSRCLISGTGLTHL